MAEILPAIMSIRNWQPAQQDWAMDTLRKAVKQKEILLCKRGISDHWLNTTYLQSKNCHPKTDWSSNIIYYHKVIWGLAETLIIWHKY